MTKKQKRAGLIGGLFVAAIGSIALILTALQGSITYFYTPSDLAAKETKPTSAIRLGGLVETGSVKHLNSESGASVEFIVTDGDASTPVSFTGILPDLFREGQGVIVQGHVQNTGHLEASTVLAKHDENYMPKEVAEALKEKGVWQESPDS